MFVSGRVGVTDFTDVPTPLFQRDRDRNSSISLEIVMRRSSAHPKNTMHSGNVRFVSTAGRLIPCCHTKFRWHQLVNVFQHHTTEFARSSSLLWLELFFTSKSLHVWTLSASSIEPNSEGIRCPHANFFFANEKQSEKNVRYGCLRGKAGITKSPSTSCPAGDAPSVPTHPCIFRREDMQHDGGQKSRTVHCSRVPRLISLFLV